MLPYSCREPTGSKGDGGSGDEEHREGTGEVGGAKELLLYAAEVVLSSGAAKDLGLLPNQAPNCLAGLDDDTLQTAPKERRGLRSALGPRRESGRVGLRAPPPPTKAVMLERFLK